MLLASLYGIVDRLETLFSSRKFTPDGHLVGSIGEVIAAHMFGLTLLPASYPDHDAEAGDGRRVQIKLTQGARGVALRAEPDHLLVLLLAPDRAIKLVYNGRGDSPGRKRANCRGTANVRFRLSVSAPSTPRCRGAIGCRVAPRSTCPCRGSGMNVAAAHVPQAVVSSPVDPIDLPLILRETTAIISGSGPTAPVAPACCQPFASTSCLGGDATKGRENDG